MSKLLSSGRRSRRQRHGSHHSVLAAIEAMEARVLLSRVVYVDDSAPAGGNGTSWALAYQDLQAALVNSQTGDEIHVGQGSYKPTTGTDPAATFQLRSGVSLYGGYAGCTAQAPNARDAAGQVSILSGDIGLVGTNTDNSYHVVTASNIDAAAILDGFTITGGNANGTSDVNGAGMYLDHASPTVRNCTFSGNSAANNAAVVAPLTADLDGNPRRANIPGVVDTGLGIAPIVDMGAFETVPRLEAEAGGPYVVLEGGTTVLQGSGRSDKVGDVAYAWDFHGNGLYSDAVGPTPTFSAVGLSAPLVMTIALRITDATGAGVIDTATVTVVPRVCYVDAAAGGANDGTSWSDALTSLQAALAHSVPGQTIRVAQGVYKPTDDDDRTAMFQLRSAVAIYGGYAGHGITDPNVRDVAQYPSILSGEIGSAATRYDNSCHVVTGSGADATAILDGFAITAGYANGTSPSDSGAGLYSDHGSPTIRNSIFRGNYATIDGGGCYNTDASSPSFTNCIFVGNYGGSGGGMYNLGSSPTLTNCTLSGNASGISGGAIDGSATSPTLANCIAWGNTSRDATQIHSSSGVPAVMCSDVQGGFAGNGNISADPLFIRTPAVGADGWWGSSDDDYGDLHVKASSPTADAGSNGAVPAGILTDLDGNPRFDDLPGAPDTGAGAAPIVDMGAYEAIPRLQAEAGGPYVLFEGDTPGAAR